MRMRVCWSDGSGVLLVKKGNRTMCISFVSDIGSFLPARLISGLIEKAIPGWREAAERDYKAKRGECRLDVVKGENDSSVYVVRRIFKKSSRSQITAVLRLTSSGEIRKFECATIGELLPIIDEISRQFRQVNEEIQIVTECKYNE